MSVRGSSTPSFLRVQVRDGGLIFRLKPGRLLVGDTTPTDQVRMVTLTIVLKSCRRHHHTARGRARSSRMRSRQVEGGIRLDLLVFDEGGREAQLKLHTQPTVGGRTLVDADRIKAARIGDPLGVDLTERACRPLIRLFTHPPAVGRWWTPTGSRRHASPGQRVSTSHVLQPLLFSLSLVVVSIRCLRRTTRGRARHRACDRWRVGGAPGCEEVVAEGGREAQNRLHTQPTAGSRTLVDADRIKAARIGDPLGVDLTERACRPLIRLSTHPTAAASTCQQAASFTSSFFDLHVLQQRCSSITHLHSSIFNPVPTPGHPRRARHCACAQRRVGAPGCSGG
ncbi:hypothetical protein EVAR_43663_1 [Eumeta japonica]|uniref:Uncharacterized protein n=1 Tax=Eumeta variegata TaxID=151549 RepID=A0A4C1XW62_EUMVA|nr:hypothetical protein EVAR_43663_1 [Eumeta japonica]